MKKLEELYKAIKYMRLMILKHYDEIRDIARDWFNFGMPKLFDFKYDKTRLQRRFKWNTSELANFNDLVIRFRSLFVEYTKDYCKIRFSSAEVARVNVTLYPLMHKCPAGNNSSTSRF